VEVEKKITVSDPNMTPRGWHARQQRLEHHLFDRRLIVTVTAVGVSVKVKKQLAREQS